MTIRIDGFMSNSFLHQLLSLLTVLVAEVSPDGRWVSFVWYRVHENMDVFVAPTDGSQSPIALTHTPEATLFVRWTNDSRAVVVAQDHSRDEHDRLFLVWLHEPLAMHPLTDDQHTYFVRGGSLDAGQFRHDDVLVQMSYQGSQLTYSQFAHLLVVSNARLR